MPFIVPAKALVLATGFLSTLASLGGGLMLYYEGLQVLEKSVEERSKSELAATYTVMRTAFEEPVRVNNLMGHLLTYRNFSNFEELSKFGYDLMGAQVVSGGVYAMSWFFFDPKNPLSTTKGWSDGFWYEVLEDGSLTYIYQHYQPSQLNANPDCVDICEFCYTVDPETMEIVGEAYNYTDATILSLTEGGDWYDLTKGWETTGAQIWSGPWVWYSYDGTPGQYFMHSNILPASDKPLLKGLQVQTVGFVLGENWQKEFGKLRSTATMVVVNQAGALMANNIGVPLSRSGCTNSDSLTEACLTKVTDLPPDIQDGIRVLNHTTPGAFVRVSGYWLSRVMLFTPGPRDELNEISLMWLSPTSLVESEMTKALVLFIVFVMLVVVLDVTIGATEVLLFARPLNKMSVAMGHLESLDLDAVDQILNGIGGRLAVAEVMRLARGVSFAVQSMREYKSFLPQNVIGAVESSSGCDSLKSAPTATKQSSNASLNSHSSSTGIAGKLGLAIENTSVITAALHLPHEGIADYAAAFRRWIITIQQSQLTFKGNVYRVLGEVVVLSWSGNRGNAMRAVDLAVSVWQDAAPTQMAGVSMEKTLLGNMGTDTLRAFNILGTVVSRATSLAKLNEHYHTRVLVDGAMSKYLEVNPVFLFRSIDNLKLGESQPFKVMAYMKRIQLENAEWMYNLEDTTRAYLSYEEAFKAVVCVANKDTCEKLKEVCKEMDSAAQALVRRVERFIEGGEGPYVSCIQCVPIPGNRGLEVVSLE